MDILLETLTEEWQDLVRLSPKILLALIVFVSSVLMGRLVSGALPRGDDILFECLPHARAP